MANSLDMRITEEGPRNAVVKLTGILDTSNIIETPAIALNDFQSNEGERLILNGFRIDLIEYSIGPGIEVLLEWSSLQPEQIFPLSGRGRISATNYGGFNPNVTLPGYNGGINLKTRNFIPGVDGQGNSIVQNFTIILELVKLYKS